MTRWLAAVCAGLGVAHSALATEPARPAVRVVGVRPTEDTTARAQAAPTLNQPRPFSGGPSVTETPPAAPGIPPPTLAPGAGPFTFLGPQPTPGVAVSPAVPATTFPCPNMDTPLYGGGYTSPVAVGGPAVFADKWWMSAEYLMWWTKSSSLPPLLTTSSPAFNGILGTGDTRVLFGNGSFGQTLHSGGRFGGGYWFGCEQRWGIDGNVWFLGRNGSEFRTDTNGVGLLARPFSNLNQGLPFSQLVGATGLATGAASIITQSQAWGAEANLRRRLAGTACARLDLLGGFRFVRLTEDLRITESFRRTPDSPRSIGVPSAISGTVIDSFRTENEFYGFNVGMQGEVRRGRWFAALTGKVAFGTAFQTAVIDGSQSILLENGTVSPAQGGLLALPGANIGRFKQNKFAVAPEVGLQIGYHVTSNCRVFVGYNFLYLSSVLRPGDQIDTGLDLTRIPNFPVAGVSPLPVVRPAPTLRDRDWFAQGVSFGIQFTW